MSDMDEIEELERLLKKADQGNRDAFETYKVKLLYGSKHLLARARRASELERENAELLEALRTIADTCTQPGRAWIAVDAVARAAIDLAALREVDEAARKAVKGRR